MHPLEANLRLTDYSIELHFQKKILSNFYLASQFLNCKSHLTRSQEARKGIIIWQWRNTSYATYYSTVTQYMICSTHKFFGSHTKIPNYSLELMFAKFATAKIAKNLNTPKLISSRWKQHWRMINILQLVAPTGAWNLRSSDYKCGALQLSYTATWLL